MRTWSEMVEDSPAWAAVQELKSLVGELQDSDAGDEAIERPNHLAAIAEARLRALDADLVYPGWLNDVGSRVANLTTQLGAYFEPPEDGPETERAAVDQAADDLAQFLTTLPAAGDVETDTVEDAYRKDLEGLRSQVAAAAQQMQEALAEASTTHSTAIEQSAAQVAELQQRLEEVKSALAETSTSVDELIDERTAAFDTALTDARASHDALRSTTEQSVAKLVGDHDTKLTEQLQAQQSEHAAQIQAQQARADDALATIETLKEKAETLVGAVGRTGLSGGFQQWEEDERKKADTWRIVAIVFGVLAALSIVALLFGRSAISDESDDFDVPLAVSSLAVPGAFGGIAAYTGRESAKHRKNQVIARRTELELASFGPFIAELPADQQAEVTALFTPVFFGQATAHMSSEKADPSDGGPQTLAKEVLARMTSVIQSRATKGDDS